VLRVVGRVDGGFADEYIDGPILQNFEIVVTEALVMPEYVAAAVQSDQAEPLHQNENLAVLEEMRSSQSEGAIESLELDFPHVQEAAGHIEEIDARRMLGGIEVVSLPAPRRVVKNHLSLFRSGLISLDVAQGLQRSDLGRLLGRELIVAKSIEAFAVRGLGVDTADPERGGQCGGKSEPLSHSLLHPTLRVSAGACAT
jgi:hypothetical protein